MANTTPFSKFMQNFTILFRRTQFKTCFLIKKFHNEQFVTCLLYAPRISTILIIVSLRKVYSYTSKDFEGTRVPECFIVFLSNPFNFLSNLRESSKFTFVWIILFAKPVEKCRAVKVNCKSALNSHSRYRGTQDSGWHIRNRKPWLPLVLKRNSASSGLPPPWQVGSWLHFRWGPWSSLKRQFKRYSSEGQRPTKVTGSGPFPAAELHAPMHRLACNQIGEPFCHFARTVLQMVLEVLLGGIEGARPSMGISKWLRKSTCRRKQAMAIYITTVGAYRILMKSTRN